VYYTATNTKACTGILSEKNSAPTYLVSHYLLENASLMCYWEMLQALLTRQPLIYCAAISVAEGKKEKEKPLALY
jgi:hypothetical protein